MKSSAVFAPLVDAFLDIGGAGAVRRQAVAETITGTGVPDADGGYPEPTRDFISLDAPLYAFALSQSGFFCLDILQALDQ